MKRLGEGIKNYIQLHMINKFNINQILFFIFTLSLAFRIGSLVVLPDRPIENDAQFSLVTAFNLSEKQNYSYDGKNPFFFREPGHIYFYSFCIDIYSSITGFKEFDLSKVCNQYTWTFSDTHVKNIILLIRIIQALIQSLTILIFTKVIIEFTTKKIALVTFLFLALYPPYFLHIHSLLREVLLGFTLVVFVAFWVKYVKSNNIIYLFFVGFFWGVNALSFQVYLILGSVILIQIFFSKIKRLDKAKHAIVLFISFLITITPWIMKVYKYYPDLRIVKTLGVSLTHEQANFMSAFRICDNEALKETYYDSFSIDNCIYNFDEKMWYYETSYSHFMKSFNGYYNIKANFLKENTTENRMKEYRLKQMYNNIKQSFFRWGQSSESIIARYSDYSIWKFVFYIIGTLSIIGSIVFIKQNYYINLIYFLHVFLFVIIGNEARRMIPIQPFVILFAVQIILFFISNISLRYKK